MTEHANALIVALLSTLAACGSGGGGAPAVARVDLVGPWTVTVKFTSGEGTLASLVNTEISGTLTIKEGDGGYTITDGAIVRPLTVTGNHAAFTYTQVGVTQTWAFTAEGTQLSGYVLVSHEGFTAEGTLTGARSAEAGRIQVTTIYTTEELTVIERVIDGDGPGGVSVVDRLVSEASRADTDR